MITCSFSDCVASLVITNSSLVFQHSASEHILVLAVAPGRRRQRRSRARTGQSGAALTAPAGHDGRPRRPPRPPLDRQPSLQRQLPPLAGGTSNGIRYVPLVQRGVLLADKRARSDAVSLSWQRFRPSPPFPVRTMRDEISLQDTPARSTRRLATRRCPRALPSCITPCPNSSTASCKSTSSNTSSRRPTAQVLPNASLCQKFCVSDQIPLAIQIMEAARRPRCPRSTTRTTR